MQILSSDIYDVPMAYDILHARDTAWEVEGLEKIEMRFCPPRRGGAGPAWFEPACGTGRYLLRAGARGRRAVGIDLSEPMVAYANRRIRRAALAGRIRIQTGDMTAFEPSIVPAGAGFAFNLINTIRHLPTDRAMIDHLRAVAGVLRTGAVYAVGISLSIYGGETASEDVWQAARGRCSVRQIIQYIPPVGRARWEQAISHMVITRPRGEEMIESSYMLRRYSARQWRAIITAGGFEIIACVDEHAEEIDPPGLGYAIYVLRPLGVRA